MNTPTEHTAANTNGDASRTSPTVSDRSHPSTVRSSFELVYSFGYGFVIGFAMAAGVGIILAWAIKATEGIDGE